MEFQFEIGDFHELKTPTIFDGNFSEYFCPVKETDKWGRTLNLSNIEPALPEASHPECPLPSKFDLKDVGSPVEPLEKPSPTDWENYYNRIEQEYAGG